MIPASEEASMSDERRSGFTRRDLVRGALVGAAAAAVPVKAPAAPVTRGIGPHAVPIALKINGKVEKIVVEPRVVLADALRERIGLTGTKVVCGRGACGACTVLVDGAAQCSCLLLAAEVQGKAITTIEGLRTDNHLSPIQEAFVAADALQCGFCTSGMVMACQTLLDRNPKPSRDEIREAISGNLCRCGTYPHVFDAVERAAGLKTADTSLTIAAPLTLAADGTRLSLDARVGPATLEALEEA
jgi:aerobic-type carbon monoxide dehydrogenase small subunit (CoxS/CutS family)